MRNYLPKQALIDTLGSLEIIPAEVWNKLSNSGTSQNFYETPESPPRVRKKNQHVEQNKSCFAWCVPTRVESNFEKPYKSSINDKSWLSELIDGLTKFSKLQEGFKEIARYVKHNKEILNENKQVFYDEIEILRIKYEYGKPAAWKYQEQCDQFDEKFIKTFIDNNFSLRNDLDSSCVKDFIENKSQGRMSHLSFSNASFNMAEQYGDLSEQTKALYYWIKKQLQRKNHPIQILNKKFAKIFWKCYQKLVDRKKASSVKLKKRLDNINEKMMTLTEEDAHGFNKPGIEETEHKIVPTFTQKPNYLLTDQVVGDAKQFINLLLKATKKFYFPVLRASEMREMKEDFVESVTNLVLSKEVDKIVFSFFRLEFSDLEQNLRDRFKEFKRMSPAEWRVNEYFRCDATSPILKIHKDINDNNHQARVSELMSINLDTQARNSLYKSTKQDMPKSFAENNNIYLDKIPEESERHPETHSCFDPIEAEYPYRRSQSFNEDQKRSPPPVERLNLAPKVWEIENRLRQKPFQRAIIKLKEINKCEGPMRKVRLLEKVNTMIKDHIWNFWEGIPIDPGHLTITQDTKIPLYIFIVIKSKIVNLAAHIKFINEFTTSYVHESYLGNNLALYESAMTIVADKEKNTIYNVIDQNEVYQTANERYASFATSHFNEDYDPFFEFENRESFAFEQLRE